VFDTAPQYGVGLSEERFGRALASWPRHDYVLSTKVGRLLRDCGPGESPPAHFIDTARRTFDYDYSYDGVMRSHDASLRRLGQHHVDILFVHDVDVMTHGSREASNTRVRQLFDRGGYRALEELRAAGAVRAIGAGVNEWEVCETLLGLGDFDCFLLAGRYTLLHQESLETFLPLCEQRGIGIVLGGPYNSGILASGAVKDAWFHYAPAPEEVLMRVAAIEAVCARHRVPLKAAALQFPLHHPCVASVIPGMRSPAEIAENLAMLRAPIPVDLWSELKQCGLIEPAAPTP
jgi:D-threo-aldose 1-dehydrogenase